MRKIKSILPGRIRIIGGKWRGRKLLLADSASLRPTANRIRETLFNWLRPAIQEARCLDCFSGSGALGIEALSHNAASATLIELKRPIAKQLIDNLNKLKVKNAKVINTNTLKYLKKRGAGYDVIFLDPPFYKNLLQQTAILLEKNGWLIKNSLIYVETEAEADLSLLPENWQLQHKKNTGKVSYSLYIRY